MQGAGEAPVAETPADVRVEAEVTRDRVDVDRVRQHADHQRAEQGDHHAPAHVAADLAGDVRGVLEADVLEEQHGQEQREHRGREDVGDEALTGRAEDPALDAGRGDLGPVTPPV